MVERERSLGNVRRWSRIDDEESPRGSSASIAAHRKHRELYVRHVESAGAESKLDCDTSIPSPPLSQSSFYMDSGSNSGRGIRSKNQQRPGEYLGDNRQAPLSLTSASFATGVRSAYAQRYQNDLSRLHARADLPASARWMDSHCHLESIMQRTWRGGGKPQVTENEHCRDLEALVASWPCELDGCICVCASRKPTKPGHPPEWKWLESNLKHFEPGSPIASKLWFTIGIHPHDASDGFWDESAERHVRQLVDHPKCVAIGECGLDFFRHGELKTGLQLRAFRAQAALAVDFQKALVVHARLMTAANEDLFLRELEQAVPLEHPVHIHCYSDSLRHALDLCAKWPNLRIGFTGAITFRDRSKGQGRGKGKHEDRKGEAHFRELIQGLPLERLLIETDGPYMCPEPFRGQTAHPGHVHRVAEKIAELQGVTLGQVMDATRRSTLTVYGV